MKLSRIFSSVLAIAVLATALALPARADAPAAGAEEFAADLLLRHDSGSGDTATAFGFSWWHRASANVGIGTTLTGLWSTSADGMLAGPTFVYDFLRFGCGSDGAGCNGNLEFGGDAGLATGSLTDQAAAQLATWIGARFYTGATWSAHFLVRYARAVQPGDAGAGGDNTLDSTAALFRFSVAVPQAAPAP